VRYRRLANVTEIYKLIFFVAELSSVNKPTKLDCHGNVPWVIEN